MRAPQCSPTCRAACAGSLSVPPGLAAHRPPSAGCRRAWRSCRARQASRAERLGLHVPGAALEERWCQWRHLGKLPTGGPCFPWLWLVPNPCSRLERKVERGWALRLVALAPQPDPAQVPSLQEEKKMAHCQITRRKRHCQRHASSQRHCRHSCCSKHVAWLSTSLPATTPRPRRTTAASCAVAHDVSERGCGLLRPGRRATRQAVVAAVGRQAGAQRWEATSWHAPARAGGAGAGQGAGKTKLRPCEPPASSTRTQAL